MAHRSDGIGKTLRFIASRGMADEDADVVADLLRQAHRMAALVLAEGAVSPELRTVAAAFLDQLATDTFAEH